jgi:hypothetical protein
MGDMLGLAAQFQSSNFWAIDLGFAEAVPVDG